MNLEKKLNLMGWGVWIFPLVTYGVALYMMGIIGYVVGAFVLSVMIVMNQFAFACGKFGIIHFLLAKTFNDSARIGYALVFVTWILGWGFAQWTWRSLLVAIGAYALARLLLTGSMSLKPLSMKSGEIRVS